MNTERWRYGCWRILSACLSVKVTEHHGIKLCIFLILLEMYHKYRLCIVIFRIVKGKNKIIFKSERFVLNKQNELHAWMSLLKQVKPVFQSCSDCCCSTVLCLTLWNTSHKYLDVGRQIIKVTNKTKDMEVFFRSTDEIHIIVVGSFRIKI